MITRSIIRKEWLYIILFSFFALFLLFPIVWIVLLSFKTRVDALTIPPKWLFVPTLSNYHDAFIAGRHSETIINSFVIAFFSSFFACIFGVPAAYAASRNLIKMKRMLLTILLTVRMTPATVIALPLFLLFSGLKITDNYVGIVLVHGAMNIPIAVWFMKIFFDRIPTEIDDASMLDGHSRKVTFFKIAVPNALFGLIVTFILCFIFSWNEMFLSLMLTGFDTMPFTVAIPALVTPHGTYWGQVSAIATLSITPSLLLIFFLRRLFFK